MALERRVGPVLDSQVCSPDCPEGLSCRNTAQYPANCSVRTNSSFVSDAWICSTPAPSAAPESAQCPSHGPCVGGSQSLQMRSQMAQVLAYLVRQQALPPAPAPDPPPAPAPEPTPPSPPVVTPDVSERDMAMSEEEQDAISIAAS
ncbi:UNVERIFIED_CONTAM: hypothetical protein FKN15_033580 [Acipenser sinensis]